MRTLVLSTICAGIAAVLPVASQAADLQIQLGPPPESFFPEVRVFLEQLAEAYNATQDQVTLVVAPDNPEFANQPVTLEALGDIIFVSGARYGEASTLATYAQAGFLVPLDDYVNQPEFNRDDYIGNLWDITTFHERIYGVPSLARAWAIGVNAAFCDPQTVAPHLTDWQALLAFMASEQVDVDADGVPDTMLSHTTKDSFFMWQLLFLAHGGDPDVAQSFSTNSAAWQLATAQTIDLVEQHPDLFAPSQGKDRRHDLYPHSLQFVHNDAMDPGALPLLKRRSPNWQLLPPPGTGALPNLDTTVIAIKAADPERVNAAWNFVAWLSSPAVMSAIYPAADLVPLRRSIVQSLSDESMQIFAAALERVDFQRPSPIEHAELAVVREQLRSAEHE